MRFIISHWQLLTSRRLILLLLLTLLIFAHPDQAHALGGYPPPPGGAICYDQGSPPQPVGGFSVAIIYCIKAVLADALDGRNASGVVGISQGYLNAIVGYFASYTWATIILAFTFFGIRLMTVSVDHLLRESASLLFRAALVLYLTDALTNANFYSSASGTGLYAALTDATDELISFVSQAFTINIACSLPPLPAGANPVVYKVWQAFDCLFHDMLGVTSNPAVIAGSLVVLVGAAIFSGGLAIYAFIFACVLFLAALFTLARAIFTVLLSYFTLALLTIVAPLMIPLLMFDHEYLKELFWNWVGLIISTLFQPLFIVGYLGFAILILDQFVHGNFSDPHCQQANLGTYSNEPQQTVVSTGSGVCSFQQLLAKCSPITACIEQNAPFSLDLNVSFNSFQNQDCGKKCNCSFPDCGWNGCWYLCNIGNAIAAIIQGFELIVNGAEHIPFFGKDITAVITWAADQVQNFINAAVNLIFSAPRLTGFPLKQFFTTVCAFLATMLALRELLEVIPHLSRRITLSVGLGLLQLAQVPFEALAAKAVQGLNQKLKGAHKKAKEKGYGSGKQAAGTVARKGLSAMSKK